MSFLVFKYYVKTHFKSTARGLSDEATGYWLDVSMRKKDLKAINMMVFQFSKNLTFIAVVAISKWCEGLLSKWRTIHNLIS